MEIQLLKRKKQKKSARRFILWHIPQAQRKLFCVAGRVAAFLLSLISLASAYFVFHVISSPSLKMQADLQWELYMLALIVNSFLWIWVGVFIFRFQPNIDKNDSMEN